MEKKTLTLLFSITCKWLMFNFLPFVDMTYYLSSLEHPSQSNQKENSFWIDSLYTRNELRLKNGPGLLIKVGQRRISLALVFV